MVPLVGRSVWVPFPSVLSLSLSVVVPKPLALDPAVGCLLLVAAVRMYVRTQVHVRICTYVLIQYTYSDTLPRALLLVCTVLYVCPIDACPPLA